MSGWLDLQSMRIVVYDTQWLQQWLCQHGFLFWFQFGCPCHTCVLQPITPYQMPDWLISSSFQFWACVNWSLIHMPWFLLLPYMCIPQSQSSVLHVGDTDYHMSWRGNQASTLHSCLLPSWWNRSHKYSRIELIHYPMLPALSRLHCWLIVIQT